MITYVYTLQAAPHLGIDYDTLSGVINSHFELTSRELREKAIGSVSPKYTTFGTLIEQSREITNL